MNRGLKRESTGAWIKLGSRSEMPPVDLDGLRRRKNGKGENGPMLSPGAKSNVQLLQFFMQIRKRCSPASAFATCQMSKMVRMWHLFHFIFHLPHHLHQGDARSKFTVGGFLVPKPGTALLDSRHCIALHAASASWARLGNHSTATLHGMAFSYWLASSLSALCHA